MIRLLLCIALLFATAPPLHGQAQGAAAADEPSAWRPLRIAKWTTVTLSAAAALYGFANNRRADDAFEQIELVCVAQPTRCANRLPNGSYQDAELETEYQHVRSLDRRARSALIGSQIGIAASVVMFIIDLRNGRPPDNIPYEPRSLEVAPTRDGGVSVAVRRPVPLPF